MPRRLTCLVTRYVFSLDSVGALKISYLVLEDMSSVKGGVQSVENEERETEKIEIIVINHKKNAKNPDKVNKNVVYLFTYKYHEARAKAIRRPSKG